MDLNEKIEKVLEKVQKAPRYTGGENARYISAFAFRILMRWV